MVTLAVDTSHPVGGVSLGRDGAVLGTLSFGGASSHLLEIGRCVDELLDEYDLDAGRIDRIALVIGPGSFTGLRVGLSYVKGLRAGLDADVVTIGTLELMALPQLDGGRTVCPMIDARKNEVYAAIYGTGASSGAGPACSAETLVEPRVQRPDDFLAEAAPYAPVFVGSGAAAYRDVIDRITGNRIDVLNDNPPSTAYLCRIASRLAPLPEQEIRELVPCYIRASEAELKKLKPIDPHA